MPSDVQAAIAALREFMADPLVRTGAPVAEWTEREARLRRAIEREVHIGRVAGLRQAAAVLAEWAASGSPAEDDGEPITVDEGKAIERASARVCDLADAIEHHG